MPDIKFGCTLCGRCCQNHSLPLSLEEAIGWLENGGNVAIFCDADTSDSEPVAHNLRAEHRRKRTFGALCGSNRMRVHVLFVGVVSGACMNLDQDMKCRIYERRPLVCRIYPAEMSPLITFDMLRKACPPEAWEQGDTLFSDGKLVDLNLQWLIEKSMQTNHDDAPRKRLLCRDLNMDVAAVADEGFVSYEPDRQILLTALRKARGADADCEMQDWHWRLYTFLKASGDSLRGKGFEVLPEGRLSKNYTFLHAPARPVEELSPT